MTFHSTECLSKETKQLQELDLEVVCPAGGSQRLPRMLGMTLAKELIFTGGFTETLTHRMLVFQRGLCVSCSLFVGYQVGVWEGRQLWRWGS